MSTNASIAIQKENGSIRSIYVHYDGYPSNIAPILTKHYNAPEKINELLDQGDASILGTTIEPSPLVQRFGFAGTFHEEFKKLPKEEQEELERTKWDDDYSLFYKRDRGEDGVDAQESISLSSWINRHGQQYNYVYTTISEDNEAHWYLVPSRPTAQMVSLDKYAHEEGDDE